MPYKNIVFVKLEKRLFDDPRWYMMSETSQLNYIKFILFATATSNLIPTNLVAIKKSFKTNQRLKTLELSIKEIQDNFPKFVKKIVNNKEYFMFDGFEEKTNYIPNKEIHGKSHGHPRVVVDKDKEKEEDKDSVKLPFNEVVSYLNEKTGKSYRPTNTATQKHIKARFSDGFSLEDFKRVIDTKVSHWKNDGKMSLYLRPETLFGTKFESYLQEKPKNEVDML